MIDRILAGKPAVLTFTKDYRELLHGDLAPGSEVEIYYDAERLPQVISTPGAFVECHLRFEPGATPVVVRLQSYGGLLQRKSGRQPGGGSMLGAHLHIPPQAPQLELWFVAQLGQAQPVFDSDFGKNFSFPFLEQDVRVVQADVVNNASSSSARFSVTVEMADDAVDCMLDYRITNQQPVAKSTTQVALVSGDSAGAGWRTWSTPAISVPLSAVVAFSVTYRRGEHDYFDDNHHRGYLAPTPIT